MKKIFLCLFLIKISYCAFSQVNLPTGSATFSLPMFTWQEEKSRLNSVIGLNYNSGNGLKVSDVANNVGQGWNLLAGGSVTRIQAGEPDDQKPRDGAIEDETKYPAGYLYDPRPYDQFSQVGCPGALPRYPLFKDKNHTYKQHNAVAVDTELDQFVFQINGRTGVFILGKHYNAGKGQILGDSKMKVWFVQDENLISQGIRTTITAFYIQDENGLKYKFSKHDLTKVLRTKYCSSNLTSTLKQPHFKNEKVYHEAAFDIGVVNPWVVNSWQLTEIEDVLTSRKIVFNYDVVRNISATAGTAISAYSGDGKNYCVITHNKSITTTPVITSVVYPDGHRVVFNYSTVNRIDLNGDRALASVDITYQGRNVSKYQLTTSYFIKNRYGTPVSDDQKKNARLCLLSVRKIGVDFKADEPPHVFDYYTTTGSGDPDDFIPASFSHFKDIWGFFNGDNGREFFGNGISLTKDIFQLSYNELRGLCFLRYGTSFALNAKAGYAKNGLLRQISFPTGGTLKYEYAQNTGILGGQDMSVGGVHVSKISSTDGGYSNGCDNPLVTNYVYTASEGSSESPLWGLEMPDNTIEMNSYYDPEDKYFYWKPLLTFGCDFTYKYPGILSKDQAVSLTTAQVIITVLSKVLNIVSNVMQVLDIVKLCLYGTPAAWTAVILDVTALVISIGLTCVLDQSKSSTTVVQYNSDINASNPLPAQFRRVEITEGSGTSGKTIMDFTSPGDYSYWENTNQSMSKKQRYASWAYGLTKMITVKNAANNIVSQTENEYDYTYAKRSLSDHGMPWYPSCKCLVKKSTSQNSIDWSDPIKFNPPTTPDVTVDDEHMIVDVYQYYSGRIELKETREKIYKQGSITQYAETITRYLYDFFNYQLTDAVVTESNGKQNFKHFTYSVDYNDVILQTLNDNNILYAPVSTTTGIVTAGGSYDYYSPGTNGQFVLNITKSEYTTIGDGNIKPLRVLEQRFIEPVSTWTENYIETARFTYDADGNLIGTKDEGDHFAIISIIILIINY